MSNRSEQLKSAYSPGVRTLEYASVATFAALEVALSVRLFEVSAAQPWLLLGVVFIAYLGADFVSGFVHWAADTWASADTPLIGKALLRPFREHHLDPLAITRHDFIETNGNNCLISIPPLLLALWLPTDQLAGMIAAQFIGALVFWVLLTNQFHKWAHTAHPARPIAWLQRLHLILPPEHHAVHHTAPFSRYYGITTGWLNAPLDRLRFYPAMERLVSALTGLVPREDDLGAGEAAKVSGAGEATRPLSRSCTGASPAVP